MPKYSDKQFEKDLKELAMLIKKNNNSMRKKNNNNNNMTRGGAKPKSMKKVVKKASTDEKRHFRVVQINNKAVSTGDIYVKKSSGTPFSAAKKALRTCCKHLKIKGSKKVNCKVSFSIQEITQGSKKKVYGPYKGTYKTIPKAEQVELPGGVVRKLKPVVKIVSK
jgi:hypothetical protein